MTVQKASFRCEEPSFEGEQRGDAIPFELRRALEKVLSCDLSTVRLRTSLDLEDLGALACMQGENVYFSPLAPALDTPAGVAVLGHELAHVLQQRAGRVIAQAESPIVEDEALEREADRVGQHCAAQLFPGFVIDPGMPLAARGGERFVPGDKAAPIQFQIPSTASFDDVVMYAFVYCSRPLVNQLSVSHVLNDIYNWAADYNPGGCPPKIALWGQARYSQMEPFLHATAPYTIKMQTDSSPWPDITNNRATFENYYWNVAHHNGPPLNRQAEALALTYLHVYPTAQADGNWRIGLNVLPSDMAAATAALVPLLANNYASMDHMKFLSPGDDAKADSVIVYCDRDANDYQQLRTDVLNAAANLRLQQRMGAMWEETQPGIGLASEPPVRGVSFSEYRCMVIFLAYWQYRRQQRPSPSLGDFRNYLADIAFGFGVDVNSPHEQGPVHILDPDFDRWWAGFEVVRKRWSTGT